MTYTVYLKSGKQLRVKAPSKIVAIAMATKDIQLGKLLPFVARNDKIETIEDFAYTAMKN